MTSRNTLRAGACALALAIGAPAHAGKLFDLQLTVAGRTGSSGFSTAEQLLDNLNDATLRNLVGTYTEQSAAALLIGYRGLRMNITTEANSPVVRLSIPGVIADQVFANGRTRNDNFNALGDFFVKDGGTVVSAVQKRLAEVSPVDPIAGNPASLQSTMAATAFDAQFTSFASNIRGTVAGKPANDNSGLVALGLRFGRYSQAGLRSELVTLPLSYTFRGFSKAGQQLTLSLPLSSGTTEGGRVVQGGVGLAYRHPVTENWSLSPAIQAAAAGSIDLGSAAAMASYSLTSQYTIPVGYWSIAVGNMIGRYDSLKIRSGDFSYDPGITNTILRNGVLLSIPFIVGQSPLALEFSAANTSFRGAALYNRYSNEVGVAIGTAKGANLPNYLRAGLSFYKGERSEGVTASFGYWF